MQCWITVEMLNWPAGEAQFVHAAPAINRACCCAIAALIGTLKIETVRVGMLLPCGRLLHRRAVQLCVTPSLQRHLSSGITYGASDADVDAIIEESLVS